jgi:hypothetical protein
VGCDFVVSSEAIGAPKKVLVDPRALAPGATVHTEVGLLRFEATLEPEASWEGLRRATDRRLSLLVVLTAVAYLGILCASILLSRRQKPPSEDEEFQHFRDDYYSMFELDNRREAREDAEEVGRLLDLPRDAFENEKTKCEESCSLVPRWVKTKGDYFAWMGKCASSDPPPFALRAPNRLEEKVALQDATARRRCNLIAHEPSLEQPGDDRFVLRGRVSVQGPPDYPFSVLAPWRAVSADAFADLLPPEPPSPYGLGEGIIPGTSDVLASRPLTADDHGTVVTTAVNEISGDIAVDVIDRALLMAGPKVRVCFARLSDEPSRPRGEVTFRLTIGIDGAVSPVYMGGPNRLDHSAAACVSSALNALEFPVHSKAAVVDYIIAFPPEGHG